MSSFKSLLKKCTFIGKRSGFYLSCMLILLVFNFLCIIFLSYILSFILVFYFNFYLCAALCAPLIKFICQTPSRNSQAPLITANQSVDQTYLCSLWYFFIYFFIQRLSHSSLKGHWQLVGSLDGSLKVSKSQQNRTLQLKQYQKNQLKCTNSRTHPRQSQGSFALVPNCQVLQNRSPAVSPAKNQFSKS